MGIFKIKLTPIEKERDWEVKYLYSSRKPKICSTCGKPISLSDPNTSFTKITSKGAKKNFETHYTHGHQFHPCTSLMADKLGL